MEYVNPDGLISFLEVVHRAVEFKQILLDHNVHIRSGSALDRGLQFLGEMRRRHENPNDKAPWTNLAADIQEALGVFHLIQLVLRNASNSEFSTIVPHLRELNKGEVAQTKRALVTDQAANKIFELAVALGIMEHGTELEIEHPLRTGRDRNPDVIARMSDGLRWGFACKVSHGDPSQTLFGLIVKGLDQIEKSTHADTGIVVLSLKNKIPHQELLPTLEIDESGMPVLGSHEDHQQVVDRMYEFLTERFKIMVGELHPDAIWDEVRDKKGLPGVLVHVMTAVGIQTQFGVVPTPIGFLQLIKFEIGPNVVPTRFTEECKAIIENVNHGLRVL